MDKATQKIRAYLLVNGSMGGTDIVDDIGVTETDVILAEQDGYIRNAAVPHGGSGSWYQV